MTTLHYHRSGKTPNHLPSLYFLLPNSIQTVLFALIVGQKCVRTIYVYCTFQFSSTNTRFYRQNTNIRLSIILNLPREWNHRCCFLFSKHFDPCKKNLPQVKTWDWLLARFRPFPATRGSTCSIVNILPVVLHWALDLFLSWKIAHSQLNWKVLVL